MKNIILILVHIVWMLPFICSAGEIVGSVDSRTPPIADRNSKFYYEDKLSTAQFLRPIVNGVERPPSWPTSLTFNPVNESLDDARRHFAREWFVMYHCDGMPVARKEWDERDIVQLRYGSDGIMTKQFTDQNLNKDGKWVYSTEPKSFSRKYRLYEVADHRFAVEYGPLEEGQNFPPTAHVRPIRVKETGELLIEIYTNTKPWDKLGPKCPNGEIEKAVLVPVPFVS